MGAHSRSTPCSTSLSWTKTANSLIPIRFGLASLSGKNGILTPQRGQAVDWGLFRPNTLFGQFQPNMRSQYSAQYNLTIEHQLTNDMKFQIGYVGSQGHRLLATHDINYGNPQTCLDLQALERTQYLASGTDCGPYYADTVFFIPTQAFDSTGAFVDVQMPSEDFIFLILQMAEVLHDSGGCYCGGVAPDRHNPHRTAPVFFSAMRSLTQLGVQQITIPVFSSVFAQDTIANSAYNSLQASLDKRFAHGLQFTAAYTFSKSFDESSSFEGILNPIDPRRSRSLSAFDARHRLVFSYYWELPFRNYSGVSGQVLNGWALSGITTFQTGFPIRILLRPITS